MTSIVERWWFTLLLWYSLGIVYILGGIALVGFSFAHLACDRCTTQPRDAALGLYFVAGLGIILVTAVAAAATAASERVPARWVLLPGLGLLLITLTTCFIVLLGSLPR